MTVKTAVGIEAGEWKKIGAVRALVRRAARVAWKRGNTGDFFIPVKDVEVSVVLSDDEHIRVLNRDYRNLDRPTNVLSFAALDADDDEPLIEPVLLGDIAVAYETTAREAAEAGISVEDHLFHLIVHGVLHLIGYDHIDDADAEVMEALEISILAENGIANPF